MSHDNIYKSLLKSSSEVQRAMARCVALIDSTDQMFMGTSMKIEAAKAGFEQKMRNFEELYRDTVHMEAHRDDRTSTYILEELSSVLSSITLDEVRQFVQAHPGIGEKIRSRVSTDFLYTQPMILMLLYAVTRHPAKVHDGWPYLEEHLRDIFHDVEMAYRY
jgi:putative GTP pyrophosphokinase